MDQSNPQQPAGTVMIFCLCGLTLDLKISPNDGFMVKCSKCGRTHLQTPKAGSKKINIFINWKEWEQ